MSHDLNEPDCETAAKLHLDWLARQVQNIVPEQPWSRNGHAPVAVEIFYDEHASGSEPWRVRYVAAVKGSKRVWRLAHGLTLPAALNAALRGESR